METWTTWDGGVWVLKSREGFVDGNKRSGDVEVWARPCGKCGAVFDKLVTRYAGDRLEKHLANARCNEHRMTQREFYQARRALHQHTRFISSVT